MDMPESKKNLEKFKKKLKNVEIYEMSGITGEGIEKIINKIADILDETPKEELYKEENTENHILYQFKKDKPFTISKENNEWVIRGKEIEKILRMTKFQTDESIMRFANKLKKIGIDEELRKLGAIDGDTVRILDFEFEYKE